MAHAQKPEFVYPRNGGAHLNRWGRQFSRLLAVEECRSAVIMIVMLDRPRSEVKWNSTGYLLHSPVSPSLHLPCVTVCHQVPNELYQQHATQRINTALATNTPLERWWVYTRHWTVHYLSFCGSALQEWVYCTPSCERTSSVRNSEICWVRNCGPRWEYVNCVRVPTQACLLICHLLAFTKLTN